MSDMAIRVEGLSKAYRIGLNEQRHETLAGTLSAIIRAPLRNYRNLRRLSRFGSEDEEDVIWALRDVGFSVERGEVVGFIGRNGAGKSTLLKILSRITEPTSGRGQVYGRVGSLLEVGTGFHPDLTGRENVYLNGTILGMRKREIDAKFGEILDFSGVEKFMDTPVKRYSSGMRVRLAFSVAAHLEPEILIIDEVLAVGDATFQEKCLGKMQTIGRSGRTVLFVSHNMAAVERLCTRVIWLQDGRIVAEGPTEEMVKRYTDAMAVQECQPLRERTDREGSGVLRFTSCGFEGENGLTATAACGRPATLCLGYEAARVLESVRVSVGVYTLRGDRVLLLANDLTAKPFGTVGDRGTFRCDFPKLPLLPGKYRVNLHASEKEVVADWVQQAATLEVLGGDFFGTGRLPPTGYGHTVVEHRWSANGS